MIHTHQPGGRKCYHFLRGSQCKSFLLGASPPSDFSARPLLRLTSRSKPRPTTLRSHRRPTIGLGFIWAPTSAARFQVLPRTLPARFGIQALPNSSAVSKSVTIGSSVTFWLALRETLEHPDYPKNTEFKLRFGPRGVLRCTATIADTAGEDPRFGKWGKQSCIDTGPLTKKRMETVDEEFLSATLDFIDRANRDKKPFFAWFNSTRMHIWTRLKRESQGKTGLGLYPDGMVEHDAQVGQLLKKLDDLGIANNTIVIYTTDNGAETFTWPDGGTTPFRGEKNTNWEGSYRVPALVRWPGLVAPRTEINSIFSAEDWVQTLTAAAGEPDIKDKLLKGYDAAGKTFKVHLDGYDQHDMLAGKGPDPRREFFYWTDDGNFAGLRYDQYKAVFMEQPAHGLEVWIQPFVPLRAPKLFNLRSDPFERAEHEAGDYVKWFVEHIFVLVPAQSIVGKFLVTFQEFPPRQKPGSFSVDQALEKMMNQKGNN